jgi:hypothetical protein
VKGDIKMLDNYTPKHDGSMHVVVFMACAFSGAIVGLIGGWFIWG